MSVATVIFSAQTANITAHASHVGLDANRHQNMSVWVYGTWGGANVTVLASPDGVTYIPISSPALTANGVVDIPYTCQSIQVAVASAGASTSLNAALI